MFHPLHIANFANTRAGALYNITMATSDLLKFSNVNDVVTVSTQEKGKRKKLIDWLFTITKAPKREGLTPFEDKFNSVVDHLY